MTCRPGACAHDVLVVGGGPTGLMLAAELALGRVDVAIVERRESQAVSGERAGGLHARTLEVLEQRGVADRFLAAGAVMQIAAFARTPLDLSDAPSRYPHGLVLGQGPIERLLHDWVVELGVPIHRGHDVVSLVQDEAGATVACADGSALRGRYVVGCDGGRSVIRKSAGIAFEGTDPSVTYLLAEAVVADAPPPGIRHGPRGVRAIGKLPDGRARMALSEPEVGHGEPTVDELRALLGAVYGTDFGLGAVTWLTRFSDMARQAARYRAGRVLLAGDAAHVHSPVGGQGLNLGVQDAANLGWKLAAVVRGDAPEALLDSYHAERHPVGARVLEATLAQSALDRGDPQTAALRAATVELLRLDEPRRRYAAMMSGLDLRYDLGPGHPLLGRRAPDVVLATADGERHLSALLHRARPLLVALGGPLDLDLAPWADRLERIEARCDGPWALPVLGPVPAPAALLVRPDGHVAWVGDGTELGLAAALTTWLGPPRA